MKLYAYNSRLSSSLYSPLHMLEITLRNAMDRQLQAAYGPDWLDGLGAGLIRYQQETIAKARQTITRQRKTIAHVTRWSPN